jgi:hypothetical protein
VSALAVRLRFARTGYGRVGLAGSLLLLALIAVGPLFAPHDPAVAGAREAEPDGERAHCAVRSFGTSSTTSRSAITFKAM